MRLVLRGSTRDGDVKFVIVLFRKRATVKDCLEHPWIKPRRKQDEVVRQQAQINMEHLKSFVARRRWKVQMKCESRSVRTVTTKYVDSEGNVKSKKRAELSGKSVLYEGEYSETDSEAENELEQKASSTNTPVASPTGTSSSGGALTSKSNAGGRLSSKIGTMASNPSAGGSFGGGVGTSKSKSGSILSSGSVNVTAASSAAHHKPQSDGGDASMFRRQRLVDNIPNIDLKPVKITEFNESIDENSDGDYDNNLQSPTGSKKMSQAEMQARIQSHLSINKDNNNASNAYDKKNIIKDETKEDEKSDVKVIDSTDEKTGMAIRTSIENKIKTNENIKVCKGDEQVDVKETEDAIIKKITTKTKTTKSVVKTTTTTTTKKGTCVLCVTVCVLSMGFTQLSFPFLHV